MTDRPSSSEGSLTPAERLAHAIGIAELESAVGRSVALAIISAFAGRSILVRATPHSNDELEQVVGGENALMIAEKLLNGERERLFFIGQPSYFAHTPIDGSAPGRVDFSERVEYTTGLAALEAIVGRTAALTIISKCAGREIFVRAIPMPDDELAELVGLDAAQAVADELLGDDDDEGRSFFVHQPTHQVTVPGEKLAPVMEAITPAQDMPLSGILGKIETLCGREAALKIAAQYGGRRLFIPLRIKPTSVLVKVIGLDAAQTLAEEWDGGSCINIPPAVYGSSAVRRDLGMKMLRDGYSPADVIRTLKVARSVVFEWSRKIKEEQK